MNFRSDQGNRPHMLSSRRDFLRSTGVLAVGTLLGSTRPVIAASGGEPARAGGLRTITYNVFGCRGYSETPESVPYLKAAASQIAARIAMELALYEPDIITFQEGPAAGTVEEIARQLGMNHAVWPGAWKGRDSYANGFPGAVITRYKIIEQQNCPMAGVVARPEDLFTRHWGRAVLETGFGKLALYSAHLHPSDDAVRAREITEVLKVIRPLLDKNVPLLFQGDLNHKPDGPDYPRWREAGLVDAFERKGSGRVETFGSAKPEKRIDYVWAHGPLATKVQECRVLFEGAFRTNPEDPRSFALSDHIPVLAGFHGGS